MVAAQDVLGFDLLRMEHFFVVRLGLDVVGHGSFARRIGQREAPENVLHRWRRKGVSASVRSSGLVSAVTGICG